MKSTARLFGARTRQWLVGFQIASLSLMTLAIVLALAPKAGIAAMAVALVGVWAFGLHLLWQLRRLDIDDPASCLAVFRANRDAGLIPALFLATAALV